MSISGCQVEPIASLYEWEKEPLAIIKDGCQADHVGLVCPPQRTDYGIRVTVESFRYQTTTQVQYTCLIRICPFAPCPQVFIFIKNKIFIYYKILIYILRRHAIVLKVVLEMMFYLKV